MKNELPILALSIALIADVVEFLATPILGYFVGAMLDIYLYRWATNYLGLNDQKDAKAVKGKLKDKIHKSLVFRILLEFVPILNFLPFSTIFVLLAWRDKTKVLALD